MSNGDPKKTRKIDRIKQELVAMLRETIHCTNHAFNWLTIVHAGGIGFRVPKDRLPWSTLEGELEKQGYAIHNWPQGVPRERDKGVYSLSAEEADKLYHAIVSDERHLQFVHRYGGMFLKQVLFPLNALVENGERITPLPHTGAFHSDGADESNDPCMPTGGRQARFKVTTQEGYNVERPHKRRRV